MTHIVLFGLAHPSPDPAIAEQAVAKQDADETNWHRRGASEFVKVSRLGYSLCGVKVDDPSAPVAHVHIDYRESGGPFCETCKRTADRLQGRE